MLEGEQGAAAEKKEEGRGKYIISTQTPYTEAEFNGVFFREAENIQVYIYVYIYIYIYNTLFGYMHFYFLLFLQ